jgi:hypothetical protein
VWAILLSGKDILERSSLGDSLTWGGYYGTGQCWQFSYLGRIFWNGAVWAILLPGEDILERSSLGDSLTWGGYSGTEQHAAGRKPPPGIRPALSAGRRERRSQIPCKDRVNIRVSQKIKKIVCASFSHSLMPLK